MGEKCERGNLPRNKVNGKINEHYFYWTLLKFKSSSHKKGSSSALAMLFIVW